MKIAIAGSHGTGKSTLGKALCEHFGFNFIPDVVPQAFRLKFPINESCPPETQMWILSKQLELERNTPEHWIMEKTLWDNVVYGSYSIKDKNVIKVIRNIVFSNHNYDLVLYLPIEFPIEDDGLRSLNVEFQKEIDKGLRKCFHKEKIKFYEISGNVKERISHSISLIERLLSNSK